MPYKICMTSMQGWYTQVEKKKKRVAVARSDSGISTIFYQNYILVLRLCHYQWLRAAPIHTTSFETFFFFWQQNLGNVTIFGKAFLGWITLNAAIFQYVHFTPPFGRLARFLSVIIACVGDIYSMRLMSRYNKHFFYFALISVSFTWRLCLECFLYFPDENSFVSADRWMETFFWPKKNL